MKSAPVVTTEKINQNLKDTISQMIPGVQKVEMLKCVLFFFSTVALVTSVKPLQICFNKN